MAVTSIRLQSEIEPRLEALAKELNRSKNWLINQAIRDFLEKNQQETKRWEDTLVALESVNSGHGVSEERVDAWLQSWGTADEKDKIRGDLMYSRAEGGDIMFNTRELLT